MHALGEYIGAQPSLDGDLCLMISIDDDLSTREKLQKLEGQRVSFDLKKYSEKRSLSANAYFWKLCDLIAKAIGSDKDTVYLLMLRDAGVFDYYELPVEASELIKAHYRYSEEDYRYKRYLVHPATDEGQEIEFVALKCYKGSHEYDSKQMSELINQTVYVANELGIDTLTKEEIDNLVNRWQGDR